jgi:magnesium transporter
VATRPRWIDLVDPSEEELRSQLPQSLHETALRQLLAPHTHDDEPRPRIESQGEYVLGVLLLAIAVKEQDRIYYQEVDFVLTPDRLVSVSKTPPDEEPFDPAPAKEACKAYEQPGMFAFHLVDDVAERYLDLIDDLNDEIDELEDRIESARPGEIRERLSNLRHDILRIRRTLTPTRDAVHKIVDGRIEVDDAELFPREVELHFADAYDKLLRATEALETSRDLIAGVRDYVQGVIAHNQNEISKRLTMVASLLLVPTFIVGLYGQNFRNIPELHWGFGYWWSWGWIVLTTIVQLVYFRWKRWI